MALGNKEIMAKNIKKYMAIKGVNQTEMCNALGFKFMTLSDWLHAKTYPRIDKIELMALGQHDSAVDKEITVGVDGMAQVPYAGNLKLVGLTLDEAKNLIQSKLSKYFKIPEYYIILKSYGPRKVYVMGNVYSPGIKEMSVDNMSVYAAVSSAGGVDKKGRSKHVQVLRQIDDRLYFKEVNLDAFVKKHDLSQNIAIEDGDIVYVPDSGKVIFSEDIAPYINIYAIYRSIVK